MKTQVFTSFVLSAALIMTGLPLAGFGQSNQANAQINITGITVRTVAGGAKVLEISWDVSAQGGALAQKFDVRADAKIFGGGNATRTISLNGEARFTKLLFNPFDASGATNSNTGAPTITAAKEKANQTNQTNQINQPNLEKETKAKTRTISAAGDSKPASEKGNGSNSGGSIANNGNTGGIVKPAPKPGGATAGNFLIESANVTVTGIFRGGNEAVALTREFTPPANQPTGELKPRAGNNAADVALTKMIDLKQSSRASQCAPGRDCFELFTASNDFLGNGGKGFTVNLEVLYADGSRRNDAKVLSAPGRSIVLTVDNPGNKAFTSVRVSVRGEGDGQFTRKATRNELLSF